MTTKELIDYVEGELKKGEQKDAIKTRLLQNGWNSNDVEETFRLVESRTAGIESIFATAPTAPLPTSTSFWDFRSKKVYRNRKEKFIDFVFGFFIFPFGYLILWMITFMFIRSFLKTKPWTGFADVPSFLIPHNFISFIIQGVIFFIFAIIIIHFFRKRKYIALGASSSFLLNFLFFAFIIFLLLVLVGLVG